MTDNVLNNALSGLLPFLQHHSACTLANALLERLSTHLATELHYIRTGKKKKTLTASESIRLRKFFEIASSRWAASVDCACRNVLVQAIPKANQALEVTDQRCFGQYELRGGRQDAILVSIIVPPKRGLKGQNDERETEDRPYRCSALLEPRGS
jgi:hypothetical protein